MNLIKNDNFVSVPRRPVAQTFSEFTNLLDLRIGCSVHLDDIHIASGSDVLTGLTLIAGIRSGAVLAVEGYGENASGGGFADSSDSREKIGLSDPSIFKGVAQGGDDGLLADDAGEVLRSPFAGEDLVRHSFFWFWRRWGRCMDFKEMD